MVRATFSGNMSKFKVLILTVGLVLAGGAGIFKVHAAQSLTTFGTTVSPPSIELDALPGQLVRQSIKVTNGSSANLTYQANVVDFHVTGTEGDIAIDDNESTPYAASKWINVQQKTFTLAQKDTAVINFTITVPPNAEAGGHYASILFQPKQTDGPQGSGAATIPRVGTLILIRLPGATDENAIIEKISPKTFVGAWDELQGTDGKTKILVAKNENLNAEHHQWLFLNSGPIAFDTLFKNLGSVHVKPAGTMTITNLFGQKEADLAIDPRNVFPGGERRITTVWPGGWRWGLFYRAKLTALYGAKNQILTGETWFIAFPLPVLIAILVLIILIFLLRKRLRRIMRILIRGE